jgi:hypothetical protein
MQLKIVITNKLKIMGCRFTKLEKKLIENTILSFITKNKRGYHQINFIDK